MANPKNPDAEEQRLWRAAYIDKQPVVIDGREWDVTVDRFSGDPVGVVDFDFTDGWSTWNTASSKWDAPAEPIDIEEMFRIHKETQERLANAPPPVIPVSAKVYRLLEIHVGFASEHPRLYKKRFGRSPRARMANGRRMRSAQHHYHRRKRKKGKLWVT